VTSTVAFHFTFFPEEYRLVVTSRIQLGINFNRFSGYQNLTEGPRQATKKQKLQGVARPTCSLPGPGEGQSNLHVSRLLGRNKSVT